MPIYLIEIHQLNIQKKKKKTSTMEELKDKSLHLTAEKLAEELQKMDNYKGFHEKLQVLLYKQLLC